MVQLRKRNARDSYRKDLLGEILWKKKDCIRKENYIIGKGKKKGVDYGKG